MITVYLVVDRNMENSRSDDTLHKRFESFEGKKKIELFENDNGSINKMYSLSLLGSMLHGI